MPVSVILPVLDPAGLHVQIFDATVQASGRDAPIVVAALPVGRACCDMHAVNDAINSASIGSRRILVIETVSVLKSYLHCRTIPAISPG